MNDFADARSCPQELFDRMPGAEPKCRAQRVFVRKHLLDALMGMRQRLGSVSLDGGLRHAPDVDLFHGGGSTGQLQCIIGRSACLRVLNFVLNRFDQFDQQFALGAFFFDQFRQ